MPKIHKKIDEETLPLPFPQRAAPKDERARQPVEATKNESPSAEYLARLEEEREENRRDIEALHERPRFYPRRVH